MNAKLAGFLFGIILNAVPALLISFFADERERTFVFFIALLVICCLEGLARLWWFIKFWTVYKARDGETSSRLLLAELYRNDMPSTLGDFDADIYLQHVMTDGDTTVSQKMKAAFWAGELAGYRGVAPFTYGIAISSSFLKAMSRYSKPFASENGRKDFPINR